MLLVPIARPINTDTVEVVGLGEMVNYLPRGHEFDSDREHTQHNVCPTYLTLIKRKQ